MKRATNQKATAAKGAQRLLDKLAARKSSPRVPQEEWDYSSCPAEERSECFMWELFRNCDAIKKDVRQLHSSFREKTFDAIWSHLGKAIFQTQRNFSLSHRRPLAICYFCPEFPDRPYLCSGDEKERKRRLKLVWGDTRKEQQARAQSLDGRFELLPDDIGFHIKVAAKTKEPICRVGPYELALLNICWHKPDSWLKEEFVAWLKENRNKEIEQWPDRGAGVPNRKDAYRLKQIGAWRLLRKMDWKAAMECSAVFGKEMDKPLFAEQSEWNEAEEKVAHWIHQQNEFHKPQAESDSKKES